MSISYIPEEPKETLENYRAEFKEEMLSKPKELAQDARLDFSYANLAIDVENIGELKNEDYALARRYGLGTSDASVVLGVNPYKTLRELIKEKASNTLSAEEKAIGDKVAVRKGVDLEPLILEKFKTAFKTDIWKPVDMYKHIEYPYIKFNFDGITGTPGAYIPAEAKVVTAPGEKHYNLMKTIYSESTGFKPLPENVANRNMSIYEKAAHYGMPPYYYTQLQQEILGCGADYGYLSVLYDRSWEFHTFFAYRDQRLLDELIIQDFKAWQKVIALNPERAYES